MSLSDELDRLTQERNEALAKVERLEAKQAEWECSQCGYHHDVDCWHKAENRALRSAIKSMRFEAARFTGFVELCDDALESGK